MIADANKALKLAEHGIQTFAGAARSLVVFFNYFLKMNYERIPLVTEYVKPGWHNDFADFVLPHYRSYYAPTIEKMYGVGGKAKEWLTMARRLRQNTVCPLARAMLALSFAAPLMSPLGMRSFTVYLWGTSLAGKTACQKFGLSAWGNPERMKATFRATTNGLEVAASRSNDLPLMIDERQAADAKMDLTGFIYALMEEIGKIRMDKNGNQRPTYSWRMPILATGEDKLVPRSSATGAFNRVMELHLEHGEELFLDVTTGEKISPGDVHRLSETHYGHAGRKFIDWLMKQRATKFKEVRAAYEYFEKLILPGREEYSSEHMRYITLAATADYLSGKYVIGDEASDAQRKTEALEMATYLVGKLERAEDLTDARRSWGWLMEFISANYNHFTSNFTSHHMVDKDLNGPLYAKEPIYGALRYDKDGLSKILLYPHRLREKMSEAKYPVEKCLADWRARGWIESDKEGKNPKGHARNEDGPTHLRMVIIPKEYASLIHVKED